MAIKHFKASEHSPESPSALKVSDTATVTTFDREVQSDAENRLLPTVFIVKKGDATASKAAGPGAIYVIEGELHVEDVDDPKNPIILATAGDVILFDPGVVNKISSPSRAKAFAIGYVPKPLVLSDLVIQS